MLRFNPNAFMVIKSTIPVGYTTVSYTHLDVYKRQMLHMIGIQMLMIFPLSLEKLKNCLRNLIMW